MRKRIVALLLGVCLCLGLCACQNNANGPANNTAAPGNNGGSTQADNAGPVRDDLIMCMSSDVNGLDPSAYAVTSDLQVMRQIFDTLLRLDPDGTAHPQVAESWETNEDGTEWTFHIREGILFHDGTPLTAKDVVWSYNRCINEGILTGALSMMDHAEYVDDNTAKVYLKYPYSAALTVFSLRVRITKENVTEGFESNPIGCGPYKFVSHNSGESIELEAFDDYYLGAPAIKHLTFKIIPDKSTQLAALQAGDVDVVIDPSIDSREVVEGADGLTWGGSTNGAVYWFVINSTVEPTNDLKVRQAICYAIDAEGCLLAAANGEGVVCDTIFTPGCIASPASIYERAYPYDPDMAKSLLDEYKAEKGVSSVSVEIMTKSNTPNEMASATAALDMLSAVGFDVTLTPLDATASHGRGLSGDYQITTYNTGVPLNDADNFWQVLHSSSGSHMNQFDSDELDALLDEARQTTGGEEVRRELYAQVQAVLDENAIYVPLFTPDLPIAYNSNIKGFVPHPSNFYWVIDMSW